MHQHHRHAKASLFCFGWFGLVVLGLVYLLAPGIPMRALALVGGAAAVRQQGQRWLDQLQRGSGLPPRNR